MIEKYKNEISTCKEQINNCKNILDTINFINKKINSTTSTTAIYQFIEKEFSKIINVDYSIIAIFDTFSNKYKLNSSNSNEHLDYLEKFLDENICIKSTINLSENKFFTILNLHLKKNYKAFPLIHNSKSYGILFVYKNNENISKEQIKLIQVISEIITLAIANTYLHNKLETNNEDKINFLTYSTHELKTPLNSINGFITLLKHNNLSKEKQTKFQNNILNATKYLTQMVEYTLDILRTETKYFQLNYECFETNTTILEIIDILDNKKCDKNINLKISLNKQLVYADKRYFKQIIFNLLSNAYKYVNYGGTVTISTYHNRKNFYFEISNTGEGIKPEEQTKIFEFFSNIPLKQNTNTHNSGLGLSLCKKIINLHNGKIEFSSIPRKETKFWFHIPIANNKSKNNHL